MAPPQWAYQVENFVTTPDEELVCSVCHAVFCDPVICPCEHVFCRVCITKWLQNNRNCPICRKRVTKYTIKQIVPIVKNIIMKLILCCKNKEHGCDAQFTLEGCESHVKECSFELVQCKNRPCEEKLFRKDIAEHEINGCPHRYTKCKSCGSKMSSSDAPEDHDCIKSLLSRLKDKRSTIRRKNAEIKQLKNEIKNLKDSVHNSADSDPSTLSSISQDDIMINITDMDMESLSSLSSDSNDTSDSIIAVLANTESDNDSDGNQSFSGFIDLEENNHNESPHDLNEFRNAESQTVDDDQDENQNDSHNDNDSSHENNSVVVEFPEEGSEEWPRPRRPAKRRLPPLLLSTSDDEQGSGERPSLPSPKRCWRLDSCVVPPTSNGGDSGNSYMEAGPSQGSTSEGARPNDAPSTSDDTKWRFRSKAKLNKKYSKNRKSKPPTSTSPPPGQGRAVFERTLALLEQYNLDSDPEWVPAYASHQGNDTTTNSDSSSDADVSDSSSSLSDFDYFSGGDDSNNAASNILNELYSTSEDDTDWRPGLED